MRGIHHCSMHGPSRKSELHCPAQASRRPKEREDRKWRLLQFHTFPVKQLSDPVERRKLGGDNRERRGATEG
ncbi:unnamed protein product [Arctogadus glacialis]